jgi:hypothetical protein
MLDSMGEHLDEMTAEGLCRRAAELRHQSAAICGRAVTTIDWARLEHERAIDLRGRLMDAGCLPAEASAASRRRPAP